MHVTHEERDLAKAIVRMYPQLTKSRQETIRNYRKARSVLTRCRVPWKYYPAVNLLDVYILILEQPSHDFLYFTRELWRDTK